jgi:periplasmic divalent cation tolerance protein
MTEAPAPRDADVGIVLTTESSHERASTLAAALVERRAAACVTLMPVRSSYRWDGEVRMDDEVQLVIKTDPSRIAALTAAIAELHTYDLPEILVLGASASPAYAEWIGTEVSADGT